MTRRLPPLNPLRAFEAAARHLSFTLAADELNVTQSAISRQVKTLETYLQAQLFQRSSRALVLTEAGKRYLPSVHQALDIIDHATAQLFGENTRDRLFIKSSLRTFSMNWLLPRLSSLRAEHPDLEIDFGTAVSISEEHFCRESIDVALGREYPRVEGLRREEFMKEVLVAVCSPKLMSGDVPILESSDIRHHTLLHNGTRPECWAVWLHKASVVGVDTTSGLVFDSFYLTVRAAIAGMGIAILPLPIAEEPLKRGHLVMPFEVRVTSGDSYSLLYLEHRSVLPKVQAFRDWLFREAESVSGDL